MSDAEIRPQLLLRSWWELDEVGRSQVLALQIDEAQVEFSGSVERLIERLGPAPSEDAAVLAVCLGDRVAAVLAVARGERAPDWALAGDAVISGMRVDRGVQGQGIGSAALRALGTWLREHWPDRSAAALLVDVGNERGLRAYRRAGFEPFGAAEPGRIGWVQRMRMPLEAQADPPCRRSAGESGS